jgi:hypothetical protein
MNVLKSKQTWVYLSLLILSLAGAVLIHYSTRWGPWTDGDSAEYFEAARNLAMGRGLVLDRGSGLLRPLSSRPPFYSVVLSIGPLAGVDIIDFARWLNILLFPLFLFLTGAFTYRLIGNAVLSSALVIFFLVSPSFLNSFSSGLAEPLFFSLAVLSLFLLISYVQTGRRLSYFGSSICAGLSLVTRLSGAAVVGAGVIALLLLSSKQLARRVKDVALYGVISALGVGLWVYQVYSLGESAGLYRFDLSDLWDQLAPARAGFVDHGWRLLPYHAYIPEPHYRVKLLILTIFGFLLLALLWIALGRNREWASGRWRGNAHLQVVGVFSAFTFVYLVVFLFSHLFMRIPRALVIARHLTPVDFGVVVALFTLWAYFIKIFAWPRPANLLLVVFVLGFALPNFPASVELLSKLHNQGQLLTNKRWHTSELLKSVQELPEDTILISNQAEVIVLWTNRPTHRIPEIWKREPQETFTRFGDDLNEPAERLFREQGAALVLFDTITGQLRTIYGWDNEEAARSRLQAMVDGLYKCVEKADGAIYFYEPHPMCD